MLRKPSSRQIFGTPFWLFSLPLIATGWRENKDRERNPLMGPDGDHGVTEDAWEAMDYCLECHRDRLHTFVLFKDEPVVESECMHCQAIRERQDLGA